MIFKYINSREKHTKKALWVVYGLFITIIIVVGVSFLDKPFVQEEPKNNNLDRKKICELELPPFEHLIPNKAITNNKTLASLTEKGYLDKGRYRINFPPGKQWFRSDNQHRSVNYDYHAWTILAPLLATLNDPNLPDELSSNIRDLIISTSEEWFSLFPTFEEHKTGGNFAWYDMAVGLRASILPYILRMGACSDKISDEDFANWWRVAIQHAEVLSLDSFHKEHNNHGLYQALGHYVFCKNLDMIDRCSNDLVLAKSRVQDYLSNYFSSSGIHLEHSPGYQHYMQGVLNQLLIYPDISSIISPEFVGNVSETLDYFILPNNQLAQLGDTEAKQIKSVKTRPEQPEMRLFSEAGYGVVRHKNGHLIVSAAFHSRTHKHADDGTFVWFDRGHHLIVDSGRYGYRRVKQTTEQRKALREKGFWYSDPKRIYVESTHAHSTVEIDKKTDNRAKSEFYGSGVKQGFANKDGSFYFYLNMPRVSGAVMQRRAFLYQPGEWLLVVDEMTPTDDNSHDYTSWLQLGLSAENVSSSPHSASFLFGAEKLTITTLSPNTTISLFKGETEPRLVGWRAPKSDLKPAWSVGTNASGAHKVQIAYLLTLNSSPQPIRSRQPIMESMLDGSIKFEWLDNGRAVSIKLCKNWATNPDNCNIKHSN